MKSENNIYDINNIKMLKCADSKCPLICSIYIKFKKNNKGIDNLYITCYDDFHENQLLLSDYLERIKNDKIFKDFVCSGLECSNRIITDNSFYFCYDCNKFFCPNHKGHNDLHNNINKIKVLNKICIKHNSNKNIRYCQNCHKLICSLCENLCIRNGHVFVKKLEENELKEKEKLIKEHENNLNTIKETINNMKFINEKNKDIIDYYFEINNLLLTLMKLLIKLYKKDNNEKMAHNIITIFEFTNYFEKFNQAKNSKNLLLSFFQNYKDNSILKDQSEGTKTLERLKKNPNLNFGGDDGDNGDNNDNDGVIKGIKAVEIPLSAKESLLYKNLKKNKRMRPDNQITNNLNNINYEHKLYNNINDKYYYNNNEK